MPADPQEASPSPGGSLTEFNAREALEAAARAESSPGRMDGRGIVIAAGGRFVPGAYVCVRLLREFGATLPIEIWHAGPEEIPEWGRRALERCGAILHDVMPFCPGRSTAEMRGWPIKPAALMASTFKEVLFLDADCLPLRNPEFLLDSAEYRARRAIFWPDWRFHRMVEGARIWELAGLPYRGDAELETGIFLVDKESCWRELSLVQWMNDRASFWYRHVLGDKDTFYLAWRKLGRSYHLAPPGTRYRSVVLRHFWEDGEPIADHRTGTSKYALPVRRGPYTSYLTFYEGRPMIKNLYDEIMQRFFVRGFPRHVRLLEELARVRREGGPG